MSTALKDCFDDKGMIKFDPYRFDRDNETPTRIAMFDALFTEDGWLLNYHLLKNLINANPHWHWTCTAIGLYHANIFANATKSNYPTYCYFR